MGRGMGMGRGGGGGGGRGMGMGMGRAGGGAGAQPVPGAQSPGAPSVEELKSRAGALQSELAALTEQIKKLEENG